MKLIQQNKGKAAYVFKSVFNGKKNTKDLLPLNI